MPESHLYDDQKWAFAGAYEFDLSRRLLLGVAAVKGELSDTMTSKDGKVLEWKQTVELKVVKHGDKAKSAAPDSK